MQPSSSGEFEPVFLENIDCVVTHADRSRIHVTGHLYQITPIRQQLRFDHLILKPTDFISIPTPPPTPVKEHA